MAQAIFETVFDALYLSAVIFLGVRMVKGHRRRRQYLLFGLMALVLGIGDAFHLVPRAYALWSGGLVKHAAALGVGKFITSITMTAFYVLLYHVWRARYKAAGRRGLTFAAWALALARVILCLPSANGWLSANPPLSWAVFRNIPFALLGALIIILFYKSARESRDEPFRHMWLTIVLSFAFYIPVVLFADTLPAVGILMVPKTIAYVWTVLIGYLAMKGEDKQ